MLPSGRCVKTLNVQTVPSTSLHVLALASCSHTLVCVDCPGLVAALCLCSALFYADAVERLPSYPSIVIFNCINTRPSSPQHDIQIRSLKASIWNPHDISTVFLTQACLATLSAQMHNILPLNGPSNSSIFTSLAPQQLPSRLQCCAASCLQPSIPSFNPLSTRRRYAATVRRR